MMRGIGWTRAAPFVAALAVAVALTGCGGGGGGGGGPSNPGRLEATSFVGFPTAPSTGANQGQPLPQVFRDEAVEFTFAGPIDDGIFGGFVEDASGNPVEFRGLSPNSSGEIIYYAYVQQAAARSSLEIRENTLSGQMLPSYIIGRNRDRPDTLVVDPKVSSTNSFGLPGNAGYAANTEYTFRIPATNDILVMGDPVDPVGVAPLSLPITTPSFTTSPQVSLLFFTSNAFSPDPVPPQVLTVAAASGAAGTPADPLGQDEAIVVTFSKLIDPTSVDVLRNFRVRNTDILVNGEPAQVPGGLSFMEIDGRSVVTFTPTPGYGPGLPASNPTQGYNIQVRVGTFGDPTVPNILGQPQGTPPSQLELANSLEGVLTTEPTPGAAGALTISESFEDTDQRDDGFVPTFNPMIWADFSDPNNPIFLSANPISGSPTALSGPGGSPANLGTRVQFTMNIQLTTTPFPGLFSPFDAATAVNPANPPNLGANVNPNGGSHIMHLYESADLGNTRDGLELVEWGPTSNQVASSCYPSVRHWAGLTTATGPLQNPGGAQGLSINYSANYDLSTMQTPDPNGSGGVLIGAIHPYVIPQNVFSIYEPFQVFDPVFDYVGTGTGSGNLVFETNIEPGPPGGPVPPGNPPGCAVTAINLNRYRATAVTPRRRLIGAPLSVQLANFGGNITAINSNAQGYDVYDMRFTFVGAVSSVQSKFYDTGLSSPTFESITINPPPLNQPAGSVAVWEFESASMIVNATTPAAGTNTGFQAYWTGAAQDPNNPGAPTGSFDPSVLPVLSGNQFIRWKLTSRSAHLINGVQTYNGLIFNISF